LKYLSVDSSYSVSVANNRESIAEMQRIEEENNRLFIDAYGLADELIPDVPVELITLTVNPVYRYGGDLTEAERWTRFRQDTMAELVSYAIGCMMGRYRLDRPGLIYAHSGNQNFEAIYNAVKEESTDDTDEHRLRNEHLCSSVSSVDKSPFPPDADGIVPITDTNWFDDDAPNRVREFLLAVWGTETLNENMSWLAESLGQKSGETPDETIRRYLSTGFFKDHLQTYKRRPIYWCFSSGKQKAFEALVYLHRYHEGTLARMRMEYVVPLQGKMAARIDRLVDDIASASTTAQAKRLQKERDKLTRQLDELRRYDEQLRHYADQRIALDLDDGVKVNYGKFGNLLAEVKTVTGAGAD
jgi:type II restriction/modification system DNA methylase subunit YeeA